MPTGKLLPGSHDPAVPPPEPESGAGAQRAGTLSTPFSPQLRVENRTAGTATSQACGNHAKMSSTLG